MSDIIDLVNTNFEKNIDISAIESSKPNDFYKYSSKVINEMLSPLSDCEEYESIKSYFEHSKYIFDISLLDIYSIKKSYQNCEIGNKKLLWHGTQAQNIPSILENGLQIDNSQCDKSHLCFGNGIYFTDMCAKAQDYCFGPKDDEAKEGILLLCNVALGKQTEYDEPIYMDSHESDTTYYDSVMGKGNYTMRPTTPFKINGAVAKFGLIDYRNLGNGAFDFNEFVVYDQNQVSLEYLIRFKFNSNRKFKPVLKSSLN